MDFYYPNRSNMMWEVIGYIFFGDADALTDKENKTFRIDKIKELLRQKGIAVYDTACAVRRLRDNASDQHLDIVEQTDLADLLAQLPRCHDIACTGEKAAKTVCDSYGMAQPAIGDTALFVVEGRPMRLHRMPSTSRAYPLPLPQKAQYYEKLFRQLNML